MYIYTKLYQVQQEIGAIKKTAENPYFKSKYFDINTLIDMLKPLLKKHKLAVLQPVTNINGEAALKTIVVDTEDDSRLEEVTPLPNNPDPQKMGSAITYYRRYCLQSLFLLEAEDDDGNNAKPNGQPQEVQTYTEKRKVAPKVFIKDEEIPF